MHVQTMPLKQLRPAAYNPREELPETDPRYRKLRRSIQEFGLVEPLIWNRRTGNIVGGHQRLRILRELGTKEAPVAVVDLSPEREKALNLVLNNREAQSNYEPNRLARVLSELRKSSPRMFRASGFAPADLQALRRRLAPRRPVPIATPARPAFVEIILRCPCERLDAVRPRLDELLREFNMESRLQFRPAANQ